MGIRLPDLVLHAKQQVIRRTCPAKRNCSYGQPLAAMGVPKGHFSVYVGDEEGTIVLAL
ncbi:hypothetical protein SLEP1_g33727 [Rubroshorea leprosula]|uniref:Uncharacterized protein n=1 Tax=Rubroshorea leprosula TaxID=152421 RepID=A0AAV5KHI5_9ROSI|nr:hypothetical protein SLEP1_g33727 [Rubroshorea leprosula]